MGQQKNNKKLKKTRSLLTIGLIVKNEEKTLARCLDSLVPLTNELKAELIITDTGSTDKTVEIAKKYTDNVRFFQWKDDFAAARNDAIDQANSQWFLVIDADEWFESTDEVINFFKTGEYEKYEAATYYIHSYVDLNNDTYTQSTAVRLFKLNGKNRYTGAIHECLPLIPSTKILNCFVHHTGYAYETEAVKQKKHQRNLNPLLKELEVNPNDERTLYHIMSQYTTMRDWDSALGYKRQIIELMKKKPTSNFRGGLYKMIVWAETENGQLIEAINTAELYFSGSSQVYASDLDVWYLLVDVYLKMSNNKKVFEATREYLQLHADYQKGLICNADILAGAILSIDNQYYTIVVQGAVGRLLHDGQYEDALKLFRLVDLELVEEIRGQDIFWDGLVRGVAAVQPSDLLESFITKILGLKQREAQKETMFCFFASVCKFYDRDYYGTILSQLSELHEDLRQLLYEISKDFSFGSQLELLNIRFFILNVFELLLRVQGLTLDEKKPLFSIYINELQNYVKQVYNPELWAEDGMDVLPGFAQFAFIVGKNMCGVSQNDRLSYFRDLVQGAKVYPAMLPFIKELLVDEQRKDNSEA